jgi:hypothetical protein
MYNVLLLPGVKPTAVNKYFTSYNKENNDGKKNSSLFGVVGRSCVENNKKKF